MSIYNDAFTPHDDIQCEEYYGDPMSPEEYVDKLTDDGVVWDDDHEEIVFDHPEELIDESGAVTEEGYEVLAHLDSTGAFHS